MTLLGEEREIRLKLSALYTRAIDAIGTHKEDLPASTQAYIEDILSEIETLEKRIAEIEEQRKREYLEDTGKEQDNESNQTTTT